MPAPDNPLICQSCGAASPLPADLEALEFDCQYCGIHQLLPDRVVAQRRAQLDRQRRPASQPSSQPATVTTSSTGSSGLFGVMFAVFGALSVLGIVVFVLLLSPGEAEVTVRAATPGPIVEPATVEPPPPPPPVLPEETEANNGLADVRARMNALHEAGCDRVLIPPTRREDDTGMTAKFDPSTHCAIVMAATGMPDTTVHVTVTDAHGNPVDTPPPAAAFEWRFCPKIAGDHRVVIEHEGPGPYHVASYDCPKRVFAKLDPVAPPFAIEP